MAEDPWMQNPKTGAAKGTRPASTYRTHLYRMTGVDLTQIDGVGRIHGPEGGQ